MFVARNTTTYSPLSSIEFLIIKSHWISFLSSLNYILICTLTGLNYFLASWWVNSPVHVHLSIAIRATSFDLFLTSPRTQPKEADLRDQP